MTAEPLFWLGYWLFVAGIIIALLYLEINDKGDRQ